MSWPETILFYVVAVPIAIVWSKIFPSKKEEDRQKSLEKAHDEAMADLEKRK